MAFGVYVHVPFCAHRCDYCAFATWTDKHDLMEAYADACITELRRTELPDATSVFFGGGTPSMLPPDLLVRILDAIARTPAAEVTVECNPESVTPDALAAYADGGMTRVSLGVQSTQPHVLASLGRRPAPAEAAMALVAARFTTWSVDLIYGAAGEHAIDWRQTLDDVLSWDPPHLSAYALSIEPGTPLSHDRSRHPNDDASADRYLVACDVLAAAGLRNYEISNWARPGHECRHNLLYWEQGDYAGIGCAAHSHRGGRRWWNTRTPERYISLIRAGASAEAGAENLDPATRDRERLQLSLRTDHGVPADSLEDVAMLLDRQLVTRQGDRVVLTPDGRLLANEVALRLRPA
jgi:oxygen-independent coproporphyrinogen-3 oxidase